MSVALLTIGTELLRGEIDNSNARWLCEHLTDLGYDVVAVETVADDHARLLATLKRMLASHALLLVTGGLGPTTDDITTQVVATALGVTLQRHDDALATIRRRVEERGGTFRTGHEKQALFPAGAEIMPNGAGTAPGFIVRSGTATAYFMPGVPREMREMFTTTVLPRISGVLPNNCFRVCLHTFGVGESWLAERLEGLVEAHPQVVVGYRAKSSEVDIHLEAHAPDYAAARDLAVAAANDARERLGEAVYGEGELTIAQLAGRAVRARGWRLAIAESCTGGLIAHQLTSHPASDFLVGGVVAYANAAKTGMLGVSEDTLRGHGAVSAEVAAELAEGARRAFQCDVAISVTGIAGPTGATEDKPLGLCFWAVAHPRGTRVEQRVFRGERTLVQKQAAKAALDLLRRTLASERAHD